ncbi:MAG: ATP F0F1 synthase subunit gamma, partial [Planctomycetes bacterium]|nr:ATP F0F1 synthase subunit gamma [Planctomycetota bacterium]
MANLKELRGRIKSVASIAQITRAMEMVASMKLRKVQSKAQGFRPYVEEIRRMIAAVADKVAGEGDVPLFAVRDVATVGYFVVASDRGLCGSYNSNLLFALKKAAEEQVAKGRKVKFWVYGRKAYAWLTRRGFAVERFFV